MTPQAEDSARLQHLLGELYAERAARAQTHAAVIDLILARLQCARVSMWRFDGAGADITLLCFASKTAAGAFDNSERRLRRPEFIDTFNVLVESGIHISVDAMHDPALQPMRESYLVANNVVSMLDAAFVLNNRAYGMVCCEEHHRREWKQSDAFALRGIVNKLALLMSNAPDQALVSAPSLPLHVVLEEPETPGATNDRRR